MRRLFSGEDGCMCFPVMLMGIFALVGIGGLIFSIRTFAQIQSDQAGRCTITAKQLLQETVNHGPNAGQETVYHLVFHFIVQTADGHRYQAQGYDSESQDSTDQASQQAILDQYSVGKTYPCWYNPADPTQAVLTRQFDWGGVVFTGLVGVVSLLIFLFLILGIFLDKPVNPNTQ